MTTHNSQSVARAGFKAADLFEQAESAKTLPTDIQFMPPGRQEICPFVDGEPLQITIEVNQELADKLNEQLQSMRWKAHQGQGDVPFIDFNHDDAEASGEVLELFWGGNDPKNGGIRMKIKWTDAGVAALKGKMYRRFSPGWLLDKYTKEPVGIGVNVGGLVNRAAFQNIQPIVAKSGLNDAIDPFAAKVLKALDTALAPLHREVDEMLCKAGLKGNGTPQAVQVNARSTDDQPGEFFSLVNARQADRKIPFNQALAEIQRENPTSAAAYAKAMIGGPAPALPLKNHPFIVEAKAIAAERGISESDAQVHLARANYPLYRQYCASLHQSGQNRIPIKAADSGQRDFVREVLAVQARGVSFTEAATEVSYRRPDLYEKYRHSFLFPVSPLKN